LRRQQRRAELEQKRREKSLVSENALSAAISLNTSGSLPITSVKNHFVCLRYFFVCWKKSVGTYGIVKNVAFIEYICQRMFLMMVILNTGFRFFIFRLLHVHFIHHFIIIVCGRCLILPGFVGYLYHL